MSKAQMIDAIRQHNRSAEAEFLTSFDEPTLQSYLDRLTRLSNHRGPSTSWVRTGASPAIITRAA